MRNIAAAVLVVGTRLLVTGAAILTLQSCVARPAAPAALDSKPATSTQEPIRRAVATDTREFISAAATLGLSPAKDVEVLSAMLAAEIAPREVAPLKGTIPRFYSFLRLEPDDRIAASAIYDYTLTTGRLYKALVTMTLTSKRCIRSSDLIEALAAHPREIERRIPAHGGGLQTQFVFQIPMGTLAFLFTEKSECASLLHSVTSTVLY